MPCSLDRVTESSRKVKINETDGTFTLETPLIRLKYRNLNKVIKQRFFPRRDWKCFGSLEPKANSSKRKMCKQIQHCFNCIPKGECNCGVSSFEPDIYITKLVKYLLQYNIIVDRSNLPIYHVESKTATLLDMVGHYRNNPNNFVKILLKIGYSKTLKTDSHGLVMDSLPNARVQCTTENIHQLQNLCQNMVLEDTYDLKLTSSFVLYIHPSEAENGDTVIECDKLDPPQWTKEIRTRRDIMKSLSHCIDIEDQATNCSSN